MVFVGRCAAGLRPKHSFGRYANNDTVSTMRITIEF